MERTTINTNKQSNIQTNIPGFILRFAAVDDVETILFFINELAKYEKMENEVFATKEKLRESLFEKTHAEVVLAEYLGKPVGFLLFFHNYSTFLGQPGIYLEDLFLIPEVRKMGFGRKILAFLARLAIDRNCGRVEWSCLDWNMPSRHFYESLGSESKDEWIGYRLTGQAMIDLAAKA
jgi:GNAT superfamily N-acetyltransferase